MQRKSGNKVILISVDNLRADCIGANPSRKLFKQYALQNNLHTPNLDALAKYGTFFTRCYSAASYTTASHASIFTGVYPEKHHIREYFRTKLSQDIPTIFETFQSQGYKTIFATDYPFLLGDILGLNRGVEHYLIENDKKFFDIFNEHQEEDIFAFLHIGTVHSPFGLTSLNYDGTYFEKKIMDVCKQFAFEKSAEFKKEWIEREYSTKEMLLRQNYFQCVEKLYQDKQYAELMDLYIEGCNYFDAHRFKTIFEFLKEKNILDDGLVVLLADHGEEYSDRAYAHHNGVWEGIINIPLIIAGKNLPKEVLSEKVVRTIDVVPTILEYFKINHRGDFDGISLLKYMNSQSDINLTAYGETWFGNANQILDFMHLCRTSNKLGNVKSMANTVIQYSRDAEWKYLRRLNLESKSEEEFVYRIEEDILELNNLINNDSADINYLKEKVTNKLDLLALKQINIDSHRSSELELGFKNLGYLQTVKE